MSKKKNPYAAAGFRQPVVATELRFNGSKERAVGQNGEVNASNKKDLMLQVAKLIETAATNDVMTESQALSKEEKAKVHRELLTAAFDSKEGLQEVGSVLADELYVSANRDGFARRFMARQELTKGSIPTVRMRMKNVIALTASAPVRVETQLVRDNTFYPTEFYISARPYIEKRDIDRSSTDIMEEKYVEAVEGLMVQEDRTWKKMADATVGMSNTHTNIVTLDPTALGNLRNQVTRWGVPAAHWLIANDIWSDIIGNSGFQQIIDPVSKHELLLTGELANILGMTVISDAFRHPNHKILGIGEMYVVGSPVNHGQYTDRDGMEAQPLDGTQESIPGRGWFISETVSMSLSNDRSVARGRRV